jgi:hypothetical protein
MGRRQRLMTAYKRSAIKTVVLTVMLLALAQWFLHGQQHKAAPATAPATPTLEHNSHFIVVTTQRSGSRWMVDELRRARCIDCGGEYFNAKDFWTRPKMRTAVDGFLTLAPGKNVSVVGKAFEDMRDVWARKEKGTSPKRRQGFKWMLNQPMDIGAEEAFDLWLLPVLKQRRAKLIFLVRRHLLRLLVSKITNADSKGTKQHRPHAHTTEEASSVAKKVELPRRRGLLRALDRENRTMTTLKSLYETCQKAGIPSKLLVYEDLDRDNSQFNDIRSWLVDGDACAQDFDKPSKDVKIHNKTDLREYVSNWERVKFTLRGTAYQHLLCDDLRDAPESDVGRGRACD